MSLQWLTRFGRGLGLVCAATMIAGIGSAGAEDLSSVDRAAYVLYTQGAATVRHADGSSEPVVVGQTLQVGDAVTVAEGASVEVSYDLTFERVSRLDREGEMTLQRHDVSGTEVQLMRGRLLNTVKGLPTGTSFSVKTPEAVASVRGTGYEVERFVPAAEPPSTEVAVFEHQVETASVDPEGRVFGERLVDEGYRTVVEPNEPPAEVERLSDADRQEWDRFQQDVVDHAGGMPRDASGDQTAGGIGGPPGGGPPGSGGGGPPGGVGGDSVGSMSGDMQQMLAQELGVSVDQLSGMSRDQLDEAMRSHFGEGPGPSGVETGPMDPAAMKERFAQEYERLSTIDPQAAEMMRQEFEAFEKGERSFGEGEYPAFGHEGMERFGEQPDHAGAPREGEFSRETFERMMFEHPGSGAGSSAGERRGPEMEREFTREDMERWAAEHPELEQFAREQFERYQQDPTRDEFRQEFSGNFPDANRPHRIDPDGSVYFFDNGEHRHPNGTVEFHPDQNPPPPPPSGSGSGGSGGGTP